MYLDGMLWDATAIHTAYPEFMSRNMQMKILHKDKNPFIDERFNGIGSQKERLEVLNSTHPCVVLATSGMLTGGPAMEYLQHFAADAKNTLLFVGYQAEGTLGRRIQKGWKQLQLENGKLLDLNLEVVTTQGLSGHSDHRQLLAFIQSLRNKPRKVIVNHGESAKCVELARMIHKNFKIESVAPRVLETVRLL
jgi:predicted metal-dependent RNase